MAAICGDVTRSRRHSSGIQPAGAAGVAGAGRGHSANGISTPPGEPRDLSECSRHLTSQPHLKERCLLLPISQHQSSNAHFPLTDLSIPVPTRSPPPPPPHRRHPPRRLSIRRPSLPARVRSGRLPGSAAPPAVRPVGRRAGRRHCRAGPPPAVRRGVTACLIAGCRCRRRWLVSRVYTRPRRCSPGMPDAGLRPRHGSTGRAAAAWEHHGGRYGTGGHCARWEHGTGASVKSGDGL